MPAGDDKKTKRFVFIRPEDIGFERTTFVIYSDTSSVMREDENPLSPNTIGNTIIYYKTVILLDQQVATLGPKFIPTGLLLFAMHVISSKQLFIFCIKNIF